MPKGRVSPSPWQTRRHWLSDLPLVGLGEPQRGTVLAAGVFDAWGVAPVGLAAVGAALLGLMFQRREPRTDHAAA